MLDNVLRIAICQSLLALWRAHYARDKLVANHPGLVVELVSVVVRDDVTLDVPPARVGGKGSFVRGLEVALPEDRIDIVVRSMKDMPVELPQGLGLVIICRCEDPHDVFVSNTYDSLDTLPAGSIVGTSSLCRQYQLAKRRPGLIIHSLCGNVSTRLSRPDNSEYDAIILAVAGLKHLGLGSRIRTALPPEISFPAVGQGAMGIERHLDDAHTRELFAALNHHGTTLRATTKCAMNTRLENKYQIPIGSYAESIDDEVWLHTLVSAPDGSQIIHSKRRGALQDAKQMRISLTKEPLNNGAHEILAEVHNGDALV